MSYDLAFWVGPRPYSAAEADREFARRTAYFDEDAEQAPATPEIAAFLRKLLGRYPALGDIGDEDGLWATGPEPGDVNGDFACLNMTYPGARSAYDDITDTAHRHGLVCYDPQEGAPAGATRVEKAVIAALAEQQRHGPGYGVGVDRGGRFVQWCRDEQGALSLVEVQPGDLRETLLPVLEQRGWVAHSAAALA